MNWWFGPKYEPAAEAYRTATPRTVPRKTAVDALRFVVLDAETSGFDLAKDRLLSLATIEVAHGQINIAHTHSWLVFQPHASVNAAVAVHGILPAETAGGEAEARVVEELLPHLHGAVLVGHHVAFDAQMLDAALRRRFRTGLRNPLLDTATFAMQTLDAFRKTAYPGQRPPTLEEVCAHSGIEAIDRHTADGDAFTTAEVFLLMCGRLRRQLGRPLRAGDLPLKRL